MLYNMGTGSSSMLGSTNSLVPQNTAYQASSINPNKALIDQKLLEAQIAININDLVTAKTRVNEVLALGALKTDVNLLRVADMLKNRGVYVGGKRRKSKRSSKSKRKTRRKHRT